MTTGEPAGGDRVRCPSCGKPNGRDRHFCGACGAGLVRSCARCGAPSEPGDRFCGRCGHALADVPSAARPVAYTPRHLAEKIFHHRSALEGERKQVTVLFADAWWKPALTASSPRWRDSRATRTPKREKRRRRSASTSRWELRSA